MYDESHLDALALKLPESLSELEWLQQLKTVYFDGLDGESDSHQIAELNLHLCKRYGLRRMREAMIQLIKHLFCEWQVPEDGSDSEQDSEAEDGDAMDSNNDKNDENDDVNDENIMKNSSLNKSKSSVHVDEELRAKRKSILEDISNISKIGWTTVYRKQVFDAVYGEMHKYVRAKCNSMDFEESLLPLLQNWLRREMFPFTMHLLVRDKKNSELRTSLWSNLSQSVLKSFALVRASNLFEIIAEFPDSLPCVRELKDAIAATNSLSHIGKIFRPIVTRRLLHVGASTSQILDMYVSMVRSLRIIDSSDLLLNYVAAPIRAYLRNRDDTVRCIVQALLEGKGSDLHGELKRGALLEFGPDEDDEDGGPGTNWEPRRRDPELAERDTERGLDILALLISIYGSTDLFVKDYRSVLAEKLVSLKDYRADNEVATLELLKIRFGEDALHSCEVMLRDLEDSRRINVAVNQAIKNNKANEETKMMMTEEDDEEVNVVDCLVISNEYWPSVTMKDESCELHPKIHDKIKKYQNTYNLVKKPRHLEWAPFLGLVELSLDFDDGSSRSFSCSPIQASMIYHVADGSPLSVTKLARLSDIEESHAQRYMSYWISKGVVRSYQSAQENTEKDEAMIDPFMDPFLDEDSQGGFVMWYEIIESQAERALQEEKKKNKELMSEGGESDEENIDTDDEAEGEENGDLDKHSSMAAQQNMNNMISTYIKGILTNQGNLTLDRIHTMLKLVASGDSGSEMKYEMTMMQLKKFLQNMINTDIVEMDSGGYIIRKDAKASAAKREGW
jgi:anaphase-promoting complex subunit 2